MQMNSSSSLAGAWRNIRQYCHTSIAIRKLGQPVPICTVGKRDQSFDLSGVKRDQSGTYSSDSGVCSSLAFCQMMTSCHIYSFHRIVLRLHAANTSEAGADPLSNKAIATIACWCTLMESQLRQNICAVMRVFLWQPWFVKPSHCVSLNAGEMVSLVAGLSSTLIGLRPQFVLVPSPVSATLHLRQKKRLNLSVLHLQTRLPCKIIFDQ